MSPQQLLFPLTHQVSHIARRALVCIPDRVTAECALTRLQREHGAHLLKWTITKDRPPKRHPTAERYYTLRYHVREIRTEALF